MLIQEKIPQEEILNECINQIFSKSFNIMARRIQSNAGMLNDENQVVDIYVPRKCQYTNMILNSSDYSSVQINVGLVDEEGRYNQTNETVVLAGYLRQKGQSAGALEAILKQRKIYPFAQ